MRIQAEYGWLPNVQGKPGKGIQSVSAAAEFGSTLLTDRAVAAVGRGAPRYRPRNVRSGCDRECGLEQRLRDLKLLRQVRDRMDREYAQPLDVEALARGVNMSAGHLSRQFRLAYGESPYSYLMTRRIERAMALLRRGDLYVTEVCFAVGCASLGTFSTRFTELVGMPPSVYRGDRERDGGDTVVHGETSDQTDQESRSAGLRAALSVIDMDITIHSSFLPLTTRKIPWRSIGIPSDSRSASTSVGARCAGSRSGPRSSRT